MSQKSDWQATPMSLNVESPGRTDLNELFWVLSSLAECIAPDEALALSFLYSLWVASSPDFFAGLEEFLFINYVILK